MFEVCSAGSRWIHSVECLLHTFKSPGDGSCSKINVVSGLKSCRHEFELIHIEMAKPLSKGKSGGSSNIGKLSRKTKASVNWIAVYT